MAIEGGATFAENFAALLGRLRAGEGLFVIFKRPCVIAVTGQGFGHEEERGALLFGVGRGAVDDAFDEGERTVDAELGIVGDAVFGVLGEADFAGHPFGEIEEIFVGGGLEFDDAGGELKGKVGIVVEELGARVEDGFCFEGVDVVGILFDGGGEGFDGEIDGDAVFGGVGGLGEIGEVGAGELKPGFGVLGVLANVVVEFGTGFGGLAGAKEAGGLGEGGGGLGEC